MNVYCFACDLRFVVPFLMARFVWARWWALGGGLACLLGPMLGGWDQLVIAWRKRSGFAPALAPTLVPSEA